MDWLGTFLCYAIGVILAIPVLAFWVIKPTRWHKTRTRYTIVRTTQPIHVDNRVDRYRAGVQR